MPKDGTYKDSYAYKLAKGPDVPLKSAAGARAKVDVFADNRPTSYKLLDDKSK